MYAPVEYHLATCDFRQFQDDCILGIVSIVACQGNYSLVANLISFLLNCRIAGQALPIPAYTCFLVECRSAGGKAQAKREVELLAEVLAQGRLLSGAGLGCMVRCAIS